MKKNLFLIVTLPVLIMMQACENQGTKNHAEHAPVAIQWRVISNLEPAQEFSAELTFTNQGEEALPASGWTLYFNSIRMLNMDSFLPEFRASHINGDFFKIEPTDQFSGIEPGESFTKEYLAAFHSIKFTDGPQGFYFVFDDGRIAGVDSVQVAPFTEDAQTKRSAADGIPVPDGESFFRANEKLSFLPRGEWLSVTPAPKEMAFNPAAEFAIADQLTIFTDSAFKHEAEMLAGWLQAEHSIAAEIAEPAENVDTNGIYFIDSADNMSAEAYELAIAPDAIRITATARAGMFYGAQTLRSLFYDAAGRQAIQTGIIRDEPAFAYRGMHLDVARNFQPAEDVKRLLDMMATYKLNRFHFHLTDDEGWRIEIAGLPELTEIGGRRGHTADESQWLIPAYGSGPDPHSGDSFGSGWYSSEEYKEIIRFAAARHIEVIPEIDVPGHARAAIVAMKQRAKRLEEAGRAEQANLYRLDEPEDRSEYLSIQNFTDNVINVCQESTYRFLEKVVDEFINLHEEAGVPLTTIHVGGDEVPQGVWEASPRCSRLMEEEAITDPRMLQAYFFHRLEEMLSKKGLGMAGWEEVAFLNDDEGHRPNPDFKDSVIPHIWSNIWGSGTEGYAYELANSGFQVIMSHASNFYFDFAYNKHWQEPGFYWAAMFGTEEPFSFMPYNLYRNAARDSNGNPLPGNFLADAEQLTEEGRKNILGLQGQLWAETVNEQGRMDYMIYPRLLALAERAWVGEPGWSEIYSDEEMRAQRDAAWNEFANRLGQKELNRLRDYDSALNFRIPPPGAIIEDGHLKANAKFPGLQIKYELDGTRPTVNSPVYTTPVSVGNASHVSVALFDQSGRQSRSINILIK